MTEEKQQEQNLIGIPYLDDIVDINPVDDNSQQNSDSSIDAPLVIDERKKDSQTKTGKSSSEDSGIFQKLLRIIKYESYILVKLFSLFSSFEMLKLSTQNQIEPVIKSHHKKNSALIVELDHVLQVRPLLIKNLKRNFCQRTQDLHQLQRMVAVSPTHQINRILINKLRIQQSKSSLKNRLNRT